MFLLTLYLFYVQLAFSASSGAKKCDALGLCLIPESGAYVNDAGNVTCPWGMHKVSPPERNNAYVVSTAPLGETGKTFYTPGEVMDIHVTVVGEPHMKFLGILMYAVHNDGDLGVEGCPGGCDGKEEVKVGHWEAPNSLFQVSAACNDQAITHTNADVKPYHNVFRWRAPEEAGYGDVIFRVLIKQGSTNMGHFWWPMDQDLMLTEGPVSEVSEWVSGAPDEICSQICADQGLTCDRSMPTGSLDHYSAHVSKKLSCQLPLLSSCSRGSITRDDDGYCWFDNTESGLCDSEAAHVNVCDAVEVASGSERLCPCVPQDASGWTPQTTQAPTNSPSVAPTANPSTSPTQAPTHWYDPRWLDILDSSTTCANRIARPCKKGCTREYCQEECAQRDSCYFFSVARNGRCELYQHCSSTRSFNGITVEKRVATTLEPSNVPTVKPSGAPSTLPTVQPTDAPSTSRPSFQPSVMPSGEPSVTPTSAPSQQPSVMPSGEPSVTPTSAPSKSPSHWYDPRWVYIYGSETTQNKTRCAPNGGRIALFRNGHTDFSCRAECEARDACNFYWRNWKGRCELLRNCDVAIQDKSGVSVRKIVPTTVEPSTVPSLSPTTWNAPRWLEVLDDSMTCAQGHRIERPCKKHCSSAYCREQCAQNDACSFFWLSSNGRCELFDACTNTREADGVTVQKFIPTTLEPSYAPTTPAPSMAPTPVMEETLLFRQTFPYKWGAGVWSKNSEDASRNNYAILDQLEQFRFRGAFHFRLVWPNDAEGVYYEWTQTSNPLTEDAAGYVPIHAPYTERHWGGLEPSQNALMDGSVGSSNWFYAVGAKRLWRGQGYPSYAKTRSDNNYPQTQVELYVVAPVQPQ